MNSPRDIRRINFYKFCLLQMRASSRPYYRYKINKQELWLLCALYGYLILKGGNPVVGKSELFRQLTGTTRNKAMIEGYLRGCISKGFFSVWTYKRVPGSRSFGITPLGFAALDCYMNALDIVEETVRGTINTAETINNTVDPFYVLQSAA